MSARQAVVTVVQHLAFEDLGSFAQPLRELGHAQGLIGAVWPAADPEALARDTLTLMIQVNGKLRGQIDVSADASQSEIEAAALANADARRFMAGAAPKKVIVVRQKLVNIVV